MEQIDFKLKLIGGFPVGTDGYGKIKPLTVGEVVEYGYTKYMADLNIISVGVEDFLGEDVKDADESQVPSILDMILQFGGEDVDKQLESSLSLFLGGEATIDKGNLQIIINYGEDDVRVINRDNYDEIRDVIKYQNYVSHFEEKEIIDESEDEATKKFKKKLERLRKQKEALKKKRSGEDGDDSDIDFYDIISALSSKSYGLHENNVFDLTIYQVYSKFKRLEIIDQYDIGVKSMLAGASDIKLKHWSSKLD